MAPTAPPAVKDPQNYPNTHAENRSRTPDASCRVQSPPVRYNHDILVKRRRDACIEPWCVCDGVPSFLLPLGHSL